MSNATTGGPPARSAQPLLAFAVGTAYLVLGLAGYTVSEGATFTGHGGKLFGAFMVNPLHNIVHLAVGALLLVACYVGQRAAALANLAVGATLGALAGYGLVGGSGTVFALNYPDDALHLATAALLLGAAVAARRRPATA